MKIQPGHGSGGRMMQDLIHNVIKKQLGDNTIQLDDSALLDIAGSNKIAFTTDTFTITPLVFPGGDIGRLAVNGTVNDLAVMGAKPLYLSCSLIIEEGFDITLLEKILASMADEAQKAGVEVVTGDTKIIPKGSVDKLFINTSGIGICIKPPLRREIISGDKIIISGTIADHGATIMAERNKLSFGKGIASDCAHVNHLIEKMSDNYPDSIKFMRDPTRGGLASVMHEIVAAKNFSVKLIEKDLPIKNEVKGLCDILGLDPLYVANEGKVVCIVAGNKAQDIVNEMKKHELGKNAAVIGEIDQEFPGKVYMETEIGGKRIISQLADEQLPRIC